MKSHSGEQTGSKLSVYSPCKDCWCPADCMKKEMIQDKTGWKQCKLNTNIHLRYFVRNTQLQQDKDNNCGECHLVEKLFCSIILFFFQRITRELLKPVILHSDIIINYGFLTVVQMLVAQQTRILNQGLSLAHWQWSRLSMVSHYIWIQIFLFDW